MLIFFHTNLNNFNLIKNQTQILLAEQYAILRYTSVKVHSEDPFFANRRIKKLVSESIIG